MNRYDFINNEMPHAFYREALKEQAKLESAKEYYKSKIKRMNAAERFYEQIQTFDDQAEGQTQEEG